MRGLSLVAERGLLFIVVRGLLVAVASRCGGFSLRWLLVAVASRCGGFSCCGAQTLLRGMWDLPRPGVEPVSPALAGGFLTTAPSGESLLFFLFSFLLPSLPSFFFGSHIALLSLRSIQTCKSFSPKPLFI